MRTESISDRNFTGKVRFISTKSINGEIENLKQILEPQMGNILPQLEDKISSKPYDLFISRARNLRGFYAVNANTDFVNVLGADTSKKGNVSVVYAGNLNNFINAADEVMKSFEKAKDYPMLTKPQSRFKKFLNRLFSKQ